MRMSPSVISTVRLTIRIAVVLPQPEGPTRTQISPAGTSSVRWSTAGLSESAVALRRAVVPDGRSSGWGGLRVVCGSRLGHLRRAYTPVFPIQPLCARNPLALEAEPAGALGSPGDDLVQLRRLARRASAPGRRRRRSRRPRPRPRRRGSRRARRSPARAPAGAAAGSRRRRRPRAVGPPRAAARGAPVATAQASAAAIAVASAAACFWTRAKVLRSAKRSSESLDPAPSLPSPTATPAARAAG